jgi:UDP-glucose 4-epimerase
LKRALVTGASGFVGANLVRRLLRDGHETHLLIRPSHQAWRLREIANTVHIHEGDLEDREGVLRAVVAAKPDWVFHLAAYGAYSTQIGIQRMIATNLLGSVALLDASAEVGVEAFVQTGSSSEYGYKDHPAREEEVLEPNSHYAITKAAATHYCQFSARTLNINAVAVRLYSIYGPYEDPNRLIPSMILSGLRGAWPPLVSPRIGRDFVYVDDAVDAILHVASTASILPGAVYNICTGVQSTLGELAAAAKNLLNIAAEPVWSTMPERSWDTERWVGSPVRMAREIGWRARTSLESGLERTIEWFRKHPEWLRFYSERALTNITPSTVIERPI